MNKNYNRKQNRDFLNILGSEFKFVYCLGRISNSILHNKSLFLDRVTFGAAPLDGGDTHATLHYPVKLGLDV